MQKGFRHTIGLIEHTHSTNVSVEKTLQAKLHWTHLQTLPFTNSLLLTAMLPFLEDLFYDIDIFCTHTFTSKSN